jgi:adenosine deaminase
MHLSRLIAVVAAMALSAGAVQAQGGAAARLAEYRTSPPLLRAFLYRMPKGGDLHNHLSGAAYAEATIRAGAAAGNCVNPETGQVAYPPCSAPTRPIADAVHDATLNRTLVEAWSMRDFVPTSGYSGHDHFFDAFGKFGGAAPMGDMAAEVVDRAARQHMRYIELMVTFQGAAVGTLADKVAQTQPLTDDPAAFEAALRQAGIEALVAQASKDIDTVEHRMRDIMHCGTAQAEPGCMMTVRWLQQVSRVMPAQRVFASSLFGALLEKGEPRVVGLDFVAPEDDPNALRGTPGTRRKPSVSRQATWRQKGWQNGQNPLRRGNMVGLFPDPSRNCQIQGVSLVLALLERSKYGEAENLHRSRLNHAPV